MTGSATDYASKLYGAPAEIGPEVIGAADPFADCPAIVRAADARPQTWDAETLTFDAVILTPTPVARRDARGAFAEVLDPDAVDLSAVADLPVYDSHRGGSARATIGIARDLRREGDAIVATVRLSAADDVLPIRQRVAEGTIRAVSIGYRVASWSESADAAGRRTKTATAIKLTEVSLTPDPADRNARIRSNFDGGIMPDDTLDTLPDPAEVERTRRSDIRNLIRSAGLPAESADELIDSGADLDSAKAAAFDAMQSRNRPTIRVHGGGFDDPTVIRTRQADALAYRMGGADDLPEASREFADSSLLDMARASVERMGVSVRGLSRDEILTRAQHTTSDFPLVVLDAANKTAMASYKAAESPLKRLCRKQTLRDFKTSTAVRIGEMGQLEEMAESGEFTATSRGEEGEAMALKTYGRRIDLSRNLIVNDDLSLFGDTVRAFGEAAAQTEAALLVANIVDNPTLRDGMAVFDASRGNTEAKPAATLVSVGTLSDAREAMRLRVGTDGQTVIDAPPRYMLVPADLETEAEEILSAIQPATVGDVNVFSGKLMLLVEPRLPSGTFYLFSDPARLPAMRYGYLAGAEGVQVQRREMWDTLGVSFRGFLDMGTGWLDYRAAHRVESE